MSIRFVSHSPISTVSSQTTRGSGSAVSLTNNTTANVNQISLSPGTYLVWGVCTFGFGSATFTTLSASLSLTSATLATQAGGSGLGPDPLSVQVSNLTGENGNYTIICGPTILTLAATTTLYQVAQALFSAGSVSVDGTLNVIQINLP
jgi:hypothetical protein